MSTQIKTFSWIEPAKAEEIHKGIGEITRALEIVTSGYADSIERVEQLESQLAAYEEVIGHLLHERAELLGRRWEA